MRKHFSLFLILFVVFLDEVGVGLVYPMFSSMIFMPGGPLELEGVSEAIKGMYLGILLAALPIVAFFSGPILGTLSDQKGRKPLYILSLSLAIMGYVISIFGVFAKSILALILSRAVIGVAAGNMGVVSATIADLSEDGKKAKYFGLYAMAAGVGFMLGPVLGGFFSKTTFALPFFMAAIASFVNLALIYFFFRETHVVQKEVKIHYIEGLKNIKKAFRLKDLRIIFFTVICFCFGWSFFYEFLPVVWIADYRFDTSQVGFFYAYGAGFYALSSGVLIRPFQKRFRPYPLIFYSLLLLGICILVLPLLSSSFWIWIYLPIVNFLISLAYPTSSALVSDSVDKNSQGEILGILQSIQMFAFGISPLFGGTALGFHPYSPMLLGGGFMVIGSAVLVFFLREKIFKKAGKIES